MDDSFYGTILKQGLFGFALHEIILDSNGDPYDYRFLEANKTFGELTGLKPKKIIGKTIREVLPGIENSEFNWIDFYGKIAIHGGSESFEQFAEPLNKWYRVEVLSPEQNQFLTIFLDVTDQHRLTAAAIEFNQYTNMDTDFSKIAKEMLEFSGAMYVVLNRFDLNEKDYTSVGIAGLGKLVEMTASTIGFKLDGKRWKYDPVREAKIRNQKTTIFPNLSDLVGNILPFDLVTRLTKMFKVGEVVVVKTSQDQRMVGDFTLIFKKGKTLKNLRLVESYADMVGMLLGRLNAEAALRLSDKKFKAIASNTPDHIIYQDKDLRYILVINPTTGLSECEMLGKSDMELDRKGNIEEIIAYKRKVLATGQPLHLEIPVYDGQDHTKYYEGSYIPTFDEEGVTDGVIGYFRDVTERKLREEELRRAIVKAEESEQFKSAFLANMSHEIRTPMNGILGFTELLKEPDLSGEDKDKYIHVIETGGARLLAIINDVIDFSKIQSNQVEVNLSQTNLREMLHYLDDFFQPQAKKNGNELTVLCNLPDDKVFVNTDKEKIYAILTNLIKNAIKFTKNGKIEVGCSMRENTIDFYVKDTGIGVPPEQIDLIFERFQQSSTSKKGAFEGTGLGLSISKAYTDLLGGEIWVENNKQGGGASFFVRIPGA
jgi:PAS domain S-box-containing protein